MESASFDSLLVEELLEPEGKDGPRENVDFALQKRRVEEIFEALVSDLELYGRVVAYLDGQGKNGEAQWKSVEDAMENREEYDALRALLQQIDDQASKHLPGLKHSTPPLVRDVINQVREVADKSLLRPPSPPIVIKNRAEQETLRWTRLIALQESEKESLRRKIAEYERKIRERQTQRNELQQRSQREKEEQMNASHTALVELKLEGDRAAQRLRQEIASLPRLETSPEYLASLEQHDQKRKRIAKLHVQLQLWIKKYDKFIGEPMPSLLELEARMAGLEEWKENVLRPQEQRLEQLRQRIAELEANALEEKIQEMRKMHAIRVLQRAWKRTLDVKRQKKSKKGKKKKGK